MYNLKIQGSFKSTSDKTLITAMRSADSVSRCDFRQVCWTTSWTQPDGIRTLKCLHRTMARSSQGWRLEWQEEGRGHIWSCRGYLWTRKQNYLPLLMSPRPVNIVLEYLVGYGHKESKPGKVCAIWKKISPEHTDLQFSDFLWFTLLATLSGGEAVYRVDTSVFYVSCGETLFLKLSLARG